MGLLFYGGPIAIINTIKNHHEIEKIDLPMKEFFICKYGIFMINSQTQYRYNKQAVSFFSSHGELIPDKIVKNIKNAYAKKNFTKIRTELEKVYPNLLKGIEFENIYKMFYLIVKETKHFAIDLNTEKYLPHMEAYNPQAIKNLYLTGNEAIRAIDRLSPPRFPPKALPISVAIIASIIGLAVIQNLPKWIREFNAELEKGFGGQFILGLTQHIDLNNIQLAVQNLL